MKYLGVLGENITFVLGRVIPVYSMSCSVASRNILGVLGSNMLIITPENLGLDENHVTPGLEILNLST